MEPIESDSAPEASARPPWWEALSARLGDSGLHALREAALLEDGQSHESIDARLAGFDDALNWLLDAMAMAASDVETFEDELVELDAEALIELDGDDVGLEIAAEDDDLAGTNNILPPDMPPAPIETGPKTRDRRRQTAPTKPNAPRTRAPELLYEDVLWLFSINDFEAALVSLERMLVMATLPPDVREFLRLNEAKLIQLYDNYIGPFTKVPTQVAAADRPAMPRNYLGLERLEQILELVDGTRNLDALFDAAPFSRLEACAALTQLNRSGYVKLPTE